MLAVQDIQEQLGEIYGEAIETSADPNDATASTNKAPLSKDDFDVSEKRSEAT